jgi:cytochrome d ubiquinol oxidase subunit II
METLLGIDYPTWWFLLIGAVFTGYIILDGFDLGAPAHCTCFSIKKKAAALH